VAVAFALLSSLLLRHRHVSASVGCARDPAPARRSAFPPPPAVRRRGAFRARPVPVQRRCAALFALVGLFSRQWSRCSISAPTSSSSDCDQHGLRTTPLFALVAAALLLARRFLRTLPRRVGVLIGIALLSWHPGGVRRFSDGRSAAVPRAVVRALAQVGEAALLLWPHVRASLIGYAVSSVTVVSADRLRRSQGSEQPWSFIWFGITGALNGAAVLLMYSP